MLNEKYLRNLHTNLAAPQPANLQCYRHDEEERAFNRTSNRLTIGIFIGMVIIGAAAVTYWISTLPY
jgi:hypothetical protein